MGSWTKRWALIYPYSASQYLTWQEWGELKQSPVRETWSNTAKGGGSYNTIASICIQIGK